jgi:hypothetical protein
MLTHHRTSANRPTGGDATHRRTSRPEGTDAGTGTVAKERLVPNEKHLLANSICQFGTVVFSLFHLGLIMYTIDYRERLSTGARSIVPSYLRVVQCV